MIKFVRFKDKTSLLEEALETTSRAVWRKGGESDSAEATASMADPMTADLEMDNMMEGGGVWTKAGKQVTWSKRARKYIYLQRSECGGGGGGGGGDGGGGGGGGGGDGEVRELSMHMLHQLLTYSRLKQKVVKFTNQPLKPLRDSWGTNINLSLLFQS